MQTKLWTIGYGAIITSTLFKAWALYALLPTLPIYLLETLKMSHSSVGLVIAAFAVAVTLVRPVAGYIIDNFHRPAVLIISLFIMTLGYGIYPLVTTVHALLLLRLVHGSLYSICTSASATIVADIVPPSRIGQGIGIYALSLPVGMTVGPLFGLKLLKDLGPNEMFLGILGVSLLSVLGALCVRSPSKFSGKKRFSLPNLFNAKAFPISLGMFLIMVAYGSIIVFAGIYAEQKQFANVGSFYACFSATLFLSRVFSGKVFDKGYISQLVVIGLVLTALGVLSLGYAGKPIQFLMAGMICGLGFGVLMPTGQAAINNLVVSCERGAANSTYLMSYDLGIGISSLVIGFLFHKIPLAQIYRYTPWVVALAALIFVFIAIPHYHRQIRG